MINEAKLNIFPIRVKFFEDYLQLLSEKCQVFVMSGAKNKKGDPIKSRLLVP